MKVKELIKELQQLPQNDEIVITSMDDDFFCNDLVITSMDDGFFCNDFEIHSPYNDGQAQEIILPYYINDFEKDEK